MVGPSHAIFALAATVAVGRTTGITPDRLGLFCVLIGALLPDIDGRGSITKPGTLLKRVLPRFAVVFFNWIGQMVAELVQMISKHRGFFHWPLLALILMLVGYRYGLSWMSWLGFGYLTHILGDALTHEGVPFFAPWSRRSYGLGLFKTSSWTEALLDAFLLIFIVVCGYPLLTHSLLEGFEEIFSYYRKLGH
ncbi:MAG: metal-dependent hydrolase [Deltaproteobacteria bacterium]|nr:metal-dependent hydrolase [Deltaproteobacteria bacterium]